MGPRTKNYAKRLRRNPGEDERGAELIEFAVVVVLLITLLYGIITYGVILAAQATVTQAAADAARSGIVQGTGNTTNCNNSGQTVTAAGCAAVQQANTDLGWMDKGTCYETVDGSAVGGVSTAAIDCAASTIKCPSVSANTCLKVAITYNYSSAPLFPELPGLGVITPSTISSTNVMQLTNPTVP